MSTHKTPLALFAYRRPFHTQRALDSLAHCTRYMECQVHIFCDGPKSPQHFEEVEATRKVVQEWAKEHNAQVVLRDQNLGLARSIVSGVTELCEQYGRIIVLEDDLVVSPDFLDYMLQALDRYEAEENVYQVSGFMFPVEQPDKPDAFFLPLTTSWGWATWQRAWRIFDWQARGAQELLSNPDRCREFDLGGSYPYSGILRSRLEGKNDSWCILWWYSVFQTNGLVLHPRKSLVWNGGFDDTGVHSGKPQDDMQLPRESFVYPHLSSQITFPLEITAEKSVLGRIELYLRNRSKKRPMWKKVLNRIRQL